MTTIDQYYAILGLKPGASQEDIKQAYRQMAKAWHPDRFATELHLKEEAEEKIKLINEAYEKLKYYNPPYRKGKVKTNVSTPSEPWEVCYQRGVVNYEQKKFDRAIDDFTHAIRLKTDYIKAYLYRGFIYERLGYPLRAENDFETAKRIKREQNPQQSYYQQTTPTDSQNSNTPWQCVATLKKHRGKVATVAISPDGKTCASGSYDGTIKIFQLNTGREIRTLTGHSGAVSCVVFNPDGKTLASGSADRTIKLWQLSTGKLVQTFGSWLSGHKDAVLSVAISPDRKKIISGGADKTIKIWQINTGREIYDLTGYSAQVLSVAISSNGRFFVGGGMEKALRIRRLANGKLIRSVKGKSGVLSVAISPDSQTIATGSFNCNIHLWKAETGEQICTLRGHIDRVGAVTFTPNGKYLISGSWSKNIKIWDINKGEEMYTLKGHSDEVMSLACSSDGRTIVSGGADSLVKIWGMK